MIPLPWAIIGVCLLVAASGASGYWKGGKDRANAIYAQQAREAVVAQEAQDRALEAAAKEIAKIEVRNVTVRQKAETIVREVPVYGACVHDDRVFDLLNEAITGKPAPDRKLPGNRAPDGQDVSGNDAQAD
jgi:hypothetical protein